MSGYQELRDLGVVFRPFEGEKPRAGNQWSRFDASWLRREEIDVLRRVEQELYPSLDELRRERDRRPLSKQSRPGTSHPEAIPDRPQPAGG